MNQLFDQLYLFNCKNLLELNNNNSCIANNFQKLDT